MNGKIINIILFILAWLLFIVYFILHFSGEQQKLLIGDIPIETKSIIDVMIAVASLNFVYQFLYEGKKRERLRLFSSIISVLSIAFISWMMLGK